MTPTPVEQETIKLIAHDVNSNHSIRKTLNHYTWTARDVTHLVFFRVFLHTNNIPEKAGLLLTSKAIDWRTLCSDQKYGEAEVVECNASCTRHETE